MRCLTADDGHEPEAFAPLLPILDGDEKFPTPLLDVQVTKPASDGISMVVFVFGIQNDRHYHLILGASCAPYYFRKMELSCLRPTP